MTWKIRGRKYISGVDYGGPDETVVTFGYVDRKGFTHIQYQCTIKQGEIMKAFMLMGVSAQQFANAMGSMAKAFPSVEDIMKTTALSNEQIKNREGMFKQARKEKELLELRKN